MKKLQAFTLVEISVALLISSIVIVLAMNLYLQFSQSNQRILNEYDENQKLILFSFIMHNDFDKYEKAEYLMYELKLTNNNSSCLYEFTDMGIIRRTGEQTDTFNLEYQNLDYKLQNGNTGFLTNLSFELKYKQNIIPVIFTKDYSNADKINSLLNK